VPNGPSNGDEIVPALVDIGESTSLLWWLRHLACSERDLRLAVIRVGANSREVCHYLGHAD
jgi:hypothetical protein